MRKYLHDVRMPYPNYKHKVTFNNKPVFIGTPTNLKDFMTGVGMGQSQVTLLLNNQIIFPYEWEHITLHHQDVLLIQQEE